MKTQRGLRQAFAVVAMTAAASLAAPLSATAAPVPAPVPAPSPTVPGVPGATIPVNAQAAATAASDPAVQQLASLLPSIVNSLAANPEGASVAMQLLPTGALPPELAGLKEKVGAFLDGSDGGGPPIPKDAGKPVIQQFLYPTLGQNCMGAGGNSVGLALTTAGPQKAPAPGPKAGQAGIVFTALGTGPAVANPTAPLTVEWQNIDTKKSGRAILMPNPKINAEKGPGTFTTILPTGKGRIVATISGSVTTKNKGKVDTCQIVPTIGLAHI